MEKKPQITKLKLRNSEKNKDNTKLKINKNDIKINKLSICGNCYNKLSKGEEIKLHLSNGGLYCDYYFTHAGSIIID
jgi:hypothetical protein